jgi:hypothetical protein
MGRRHRISTEQCRRTPDVTGRGVSRRSKSEPLQAKTFFNSSVERAAGFVRIAASSTPR